jgi:hypothetical protein
VKGTADEIDNDRVCLHKMVRVSMPGYAAVSEAKQGEQFRKLAVKYAVRSPGMRGMCGMWDGGGWGKCCTGTKEFCYAKSIHLHPTEGIKHCITYKTTRKVVQKSDKQVIPITLLVPTSFILVSMS